MQISRRDVLKLMGGSAAGFLFTPLPWKLIDDTAIWSQNWPWIQKPVRGSQRTAFTTCALCPVGCGVKVRCIGTRPVGLAAAVGDAKHLCPMGISAHHLPFHPARVRGPVRVAPEGGNAGLQPVEFDNALESIASAIRNSPGKSVALLDRQPGRSISTLYREFVAEVPRGIYLTPASREQDFFSAYRAMGVNDPLGLDLVNAKTVISFGAPLLDGFEFQDALRRTLNKEMTVIQAETRRSGSATLASDWLPIKPGTEGILALGLANVIVHDNLFDPHLYREASDAREFFDFLKRFPPKRTAEATGLAEARIAAVARQLAGGRPALALGGGRPGAGPLGSGAEAAIAALNFLLGSVGTKGGIVVRNETPDHPCSTQQAPPTELALVPDGSIRVLIIDGAESGHPFPWHVLERKLEPGRAVVVSLSPFHSGIARHADYLFPSPTMYECYADLPTLFSSPSATFSVSAPFIPPPPTAVAPAEFILRLAAALSMSLPGTRIGGPDGLAKSRAEAIRQTGRGTVVAHADGAVTETRNIASQEDFWKMISEGACWHDEVRRPHALRFSFFGVTPDDRRKLESAGEPLTVGSRRYPLVLMPFGDGEAGSGALAPVMTKLYRESGLRTKSRLALINPETARTAGCREGSRVVLQTERGATQVEIREDESTMPDVVQTAVGPDEAAFDPAGSAAAEGILSLCGSGSEFLWRVTGATLRGGPVS